MGAVRQFMNFNSASKVSALGVAGAGVDGVMTYYADQAENPHHSSATSAVKGAATGAAWLFAEPLMWGVTLGQAGKAMGELAYQEGKNNKSQEMAIKSHVKDMGQGRSQGTLGGDFYDTQQASTMRQRQMNVLKQHRMTVESALGSEARQLHR